MCYFDQEPIGQCEICGGEIYNNDYIYNEVVMCRDCYQEAHSDDAIVEYIKAYPEDIVRYFQDVGVASGVDFVLAVLRDFRDFVQKDFDKWVVS